MREKLIAGIDVGLKVSAICIMKDYSIHSLLKTQSISALSGIRYAGIDAPLSLPRSGNFRECERKLQKMGISLFPPLSDLMIGITGRGIEMKVLLESGGVSVYEVYPYATRVILGIGRNVKKRSRSGRKSIARSLSKFVSNVPEMPEHDELDAIISALTVQLFLDGKGEEIGGRDGKIIVPRR